MVPKLELQSYIWSKLECVALLNMSPKGIRSVSSSKNIMYGPLELKKDL